VQPGSVALGVVNASPATALVPDAFGCYVLPSHSQPVLRQNECFNSGAYETSYTATFQVASPSHPYTYAWSVPSAYVSHITSGCTTTSICNIGNLTTGMQVTVSVSFSWNGSVAGGGSATADIEPWCSPTEWCG